MHSLEEIPATTWRHPVGSRWNGRLAMKLPPKTATQALAD
jgi:hypothetical protein